MWFIIGLILGGSAGAIMMALLCSDKEREK